MRSRLCLAVAVALPLVVTSLAGAASADELHYETFRFGQRAHGMGGAVMALPGEPEATFYNPAGLSLLGAGQFSGALQFYGLERRTLRKSFRARDWFTPLDETSDAFLALPSSSVIAKPVGDDGAHVFAFSTFLVDRTVESFSGSHQQSLVDFGFDEIRYTSSRALDDQVVYIGGSWSWRLNPDLSLGLSVFYARRDERRSQQKSEVLTSVDANGQQSDHFLTVTNNATINDGALLARIGAYWKPSKQVALGLACSTQSVRLHGTAELGFGITYSGEPDDPEFKPLLLNEIRKDIDATTVYPWNCRAGVAWQASPWLLLSTDVSLYLPNSYTRLDVDADTRDLFNTDSQVVNEFESDLLINGAIGVELRPSPRWPIRAGFFTNRSAAPDISDSPRASALPQVHLYGATTSFGYVGDTRSINLGAEVQWGQGDDVVVRDLSDLISEPTFVRVDREQFRFLFFISGAFEFAKATALDLIKDDEPAADDPAAAPADPVVPADASPAPALTPQPPLP